MSRRSNRSIKVSNGMREKWASPEWAHRRASKPRGRPASKPNKATMIQAQKAYDRLGRYLRQL